MYPKKEVDNLQEQPILFLLKNIEEIKEDGYIEIYTDKDIYWFTLETEFWMKSLETKDEKSIVALKEELKRIIKSEEIYLVRYTITDTNETPIITLYRNNEFIVA
jgi:hypothetical protein